MAGQRILIAFLTLVVVPVVVGNGELIAAAAAFDSALRLECPMRLWLYEDITDDGECDDLACLDATLSRPEACRFSPSSLQWVSTAGQRYKLLVHGAQLGSSQDPGKAARTPTLPLPRVVVAFGVVVHYENLQIHMPFRVLKRIIVSAECLL